MSSTVFANNMGIAHAGSGGQCVTFPDVCLTPAGPATIPVPYPNMAMSKDVVDGSKTVKVQGKMACIKGCKYETSTGDEAGSNNGIVSGTIQGAAEFILYSFDVKIEGKNVCRLGDSLTQNDKNAL